MYDAEVLNLEQISEGTFILTVRAETIRPKAGQCYSLGKKDLGINREYSIYSGASQENLEFLVRRIQGGLVSEALTDSTPGELIQIKGPFGEFCIEEVAAKSEKFLFIASGTGIAPFNSFIKTYPYLQFKLLHGIRKSEESIYFERIMGENYIPCISKPTNGSRGVRVTDKIADIVEANEFSQFYLCGNQQMITDSIKLLRQLDIDSSSIFTETFF